MQTGLVLRPDGNTYYYDASGALQKNVTVEIDGVTYEVNKNGIAAAVQPQLVETPTEPTEAPMEAAEAVNG